MLYGQGGRKALKEEEEEEGHWQEGLAGAGPWVGKHLSGNHLGRGTGSGEGMSGPGTSISPAGLVQCQVLHC